jgi:hypothetical protein
VVVPVDAHPAPAPADLVQKTPDARCERRRLQRRRRPAEPGPDAQGRRSQQSLAAAAPSSSSAFPAWGSSRVGLPSCRAVTIKKVMPYTVCGMVSTKCVKKVSYTVYTVCTQVPYTVTVKAPYSSALLYEVFVSMQETRRTPA